jgi:hypothetical protein
MLRIVLIAMLLLVACSDDAPPSANNNTNSATNNTTNNAATNNTATDNTATNNVSDMGDSDADMGPEDMTPEDMAPEDMPPDFDEQPCFHPAADPQCPPKEFGAASIMTTFVILPDNSCCFDFGGNQALDNRLGTLLSAAESLGFDVNTGIANALRFGDVIYTLEYSGLSNTVYANNFGLAFYTARDTDFDFEPNFMGMGEIYINPEALLTQSPPEPRWSFGTTSVRNNELQASDGFLKLDFPGLLDEVRINVTQAKLTATIEPDADFKGGGRVALSNGKIGGVVLRDDFFGSLNEASANCECIQRRVYSRNASGTYSCNSTIDDEISCQLSPLAGCRFLASQQYCGQIGSLSSLVDIDTDGDGANDGYSFGATFTAVGAEIWGIDPF